MDWLRRNWPDLIIGVALVAVVALIVVTLLSGGSLASLVRRDTPPELALTDTTPANDPSQTPASNNAGTANSDTGADAPDAGTDAADGGVDVFVPGVPGGQPDAAPNAAANGSAGQTQVDGAADSAGTDQAGTTQAGTTSGGAAQNAAAPADTGPLPEAAPDGGFRVAAGAVDSRDAAAGLAESYRDAGYTVTVEQQNDLYLLWIGPYAARTGAERVANRLIADDVVSDALVYTYSGPDNSAGNGADNGAEADAAAPETNTPNNEPSGNETVSVGTSEAASSQASTGTSPTATADNNVNNDSVNDNNANIADTNPTNTNPINANANAGSNGASANATTATTPATTPPTNPATATAQRYLQVGAFTSDEDAQPLREQLVAIGFNVTQNESDDGLVRLFVGPFGAAQLPQTQQRLTAVGVTDAFPVIP